MSNSSDFIGCSLIYSSCVGIKNTNKIVVLKTYLKHRQILWACYSNLFTSCMKIVNEVSHTLKERPSSRSHIELSVTLSNCNSVLMAQAKYQFISIRKRRSYKLFKIWFYKVCMTTINHCHLCRRNNGGQCVCHGSIKVKNNKRAILQIRNYIRSYQWFVYISYVFHYCHFNPIIYVCEYTVHDIQLTSQWHFLLARRINYWQLKCYTPAKVYS